MELYEVILSGYRKFRGESRLKTSGKLVAILGANEAGKSSLLNAIERINDSTSFDSTEISHDLPEGETSIIAKFLLDDDDRAAAQVPDALWYKVTKHPDGVRKWTILPWPVGRDVSHRERLVAKIAALATKPKFTEAMSELDTELLDDLTAALAGVQDSGEDLDEETIGELSALRGRLEKVWEKGVPAYARDLLPMLDAAIAAEQSPNTRLIAGGALWSRIPKFLLFGSQDRNLKSSYPLDDIRQSAPQALKNLLLVAECDLSDLLGAYNAGEDARLDTIIDRANEQLEARFRSVWKQSAVSVVISIRDQTLHIQVRNPDRRRTSFLERSDGLRQFVALQSFTAASGEDHPVLLIDEAEQHLHYDAQADLIQMLASQTIAPKVIYTTHSAGCLPEDLGDGVRLVTEDPENPESAKVKNKFWDSRQSTLSPLLIGMGASTLAFFPMRVAVVVEGESDMLLYPSLIRHSLDCSVSGMQFVPGLSRIDKQHLPMLNTVGRGVCFLVDNDPGGRELVKELVQSGIAQDQVFTLNRPGQGDVELEDFLDAHVLAAAVNELGRQHYRNGEIVSASKVPKYGKWKYVAEACAAASVSPFSKVDVAYIILDLMAADPRRSLLDSRLSANLAKVASTIRSRLGLEPC